MLHARAQGRPAAGADQRLEVIEATAEEAHFLGCNTLCLEPSVARIGAEHKLLIKEIEKRKVRVVAVPFDKPSEFGGGIRCSTHPLFREA